MTQLKDYARWFMSIILVHRPAWTTVLSSALQKNKQQNGKMDNAAQW